MKEEVKMFTVKCDNCGKLFEDEYMGYSCWGSFADAWEYASESEWIREEGEKQYCPECYSYDDNDELVLNKNRTIALQSTAKIEEGKGLPTDEEITEHIYSIIEDRIYHFEKVYHQYESSNLADALHVIKELMPPSEFGKLTEWIRPQLQSLPNKQSTLTTKDLTDIDNDRDSRT